MWAPRSRAAERRSEFVVVRSGDPPAVKARRADGAGHGRHRQAGQWQTKEGCVGGGGGGRDGGRGQGVQVGEGAPGGRMASRGVGGSRQHLRTCTDSLD